MDDFREIAHDDYSLKLSASNRFILRLSPFFTPFDFY